MPVPWEKAKAATLRALCKDFELPAARGTREEMIAYLRDVETTGLDTVLQRHTASVQNIASDSNTAIMSNTSSEKTESDDITNSLRLSIELLRHPYSMGEKDYGFDDSDEDDRDLYWEEDEDGLHWLSVFRVLINTFAGEQVGKFYFRVVDGYARGEKRRHDAEMDKIRRRDPDAASRTQISPTDFHDLMNIWDSPGPELLEFCRLLFTKNGELRKQFYTGRDKGTGVFGRELGIGSFAIICGDYRPTLDMFCIEERFRGRGIGTWAIRELMQHEALEECDFLYVWPEPKPAAPISFFGPQNIDEGQSKRLDKLFQRVGFRRVGTSPFMAYAMHDDCHPSRRLPIDQDAERNRDIIWEWDSERTILDMF